MHTDPQSLRQELDAIEDPIERARREAALLSSHDQAIVETLLSNPYVDDEQLFVPGQMPPECPWQLDPTGDPVAWIEQLWAPLKDHAPGFLAALTQSCQTIVARCRGDKWELMYILLWDDERSMALQDPDGYELMSTWIGGPPNPSPQLSADVEAAGWSLPEPLRQLYGIHDGFGCGLSEGVGAIGPAHSLELLREEWPERLDVYCDSGGNRRIFWRNPLQPDREPITLDWDRYTWELSAPRTFYQFLDWEIACDMLALDPCQPLLPVAPLPHLDQLDELAIMWRDVPLLPLDDAEIHYLYRVEVAFLHPSSTQVPDLASRWREAFIARGWSLEGEASLTPDHAELRFRKRKDVIELLCEHRAKGVIVHMGREERQSDPGERWEDYPLVLEEETGAVLRSTFMDPVEHVIIGYPLAKVEDIRQRWLEAFDGWDCTEESGRCLYLQRGDDRLVVSLRQEPLSVEVMVLEGWGETLPAPFAFLKPHLNSPLISAGSEFGSQILSIIWALSNFTRDHGSTRAERDLQRYSDAFQQEGWTQISRFQGFLGPALWLHKGALWAHPEICHQDGYEAMLYLRYVESLEAPEAWRAIWEEAGLQDGFWLEAKDDERCWATPWPVEAEQSLPTEDAIAHLRGMVKDAFEAVGWQESTGQDADDRVTFQRREESFQIQIIPEEDGDWIELHPKS